MQEKMVELNKENIKELLLTDKQFIYELIDLVNEAEEELKNEKLKENLSIDSLINENKKVLPPESIELLRDVVSISDYLTEEEQIDIVKNNYQLGKQLIDFTILPTYILRVYLINLICIYLKQNELIKIVDEKDKKVFKEVLLALESKDTNKLSKMFTKMALSYI